MKDQALKNNSHELSDSLPQARTDYQKASKKRQLLAAYIDFLILEAIYRVAAWAVEWLGFNSDIFSHKFIPVILFILAKSLTWYLRVLSPGQRALGILHLKDWGSDTVSVVLKSRFHRERWWVLTIGTLLILEGSKNLVRWTQGLPPQPFLGESVPTWFNIIFISLIGALNLAAGLLILRGKTRGVLIAMGVFITELVCVLINRMQFQNWAEAAVAARRNLQGFPLREGELQFMKTYVSIFFPLILIVGVFALVFVYRHFHTNQSSEN